MLFWIVCYCFVFLMVLTFTLLEFTIDEKTAPVITSLIVATLWPLFAVSYTWIGIKKLHHQVLKELSELGRG